MNRIFEADKNNEKMKKYIKRNELGETISHLSDFYQIFIDNLHGKNLSLIDIMKNKEIDLFIKDLKDSFMINIYDAFSYFTYNFTMNVKGIDKDNYTLQVVKYLEKQKDLRESIINCVLNQKIIKKDIFYEFLKNKNITRDDVEIISIVQRNLSELFLDDLSQFIFKSEKDHFLSTFIYNKLHNTNNQNEEKKDDKEEDIKNTYYMGNKIMKKLIEIYLNTLDISATAKFKKKLKNNKITLLLGLKLPAMKFTLGLLRTYIKNDLSNQYLDSEGYVKYITTEDENYTKKKEQGYIKMKNIFKNMEI